MAQIKNAEDAVRLLRNASIALAIIPLLDNIEESLNKPWDEETFKATDQAIEKFVNDLSQYGFDLVSNKTAGEAYGEIIAGHDQALAEMAQAQ